MAKQKGTVDRISGNDVSCPRQLPIIRIGTKQYFVDERLNQLRNVINPHDCLDF